MSATNQKIAWARRAITEMHTAEATVSREDFQYHFGAFLAFLGALRQFARLKPIYAMDEKDINYCTCVDLRNVDVHITNVAGTPRAHLFVEARTTVVNFTDSASAFGSPAGDTTQRHDGSLVPPGVLAPSDIPASTSARFFINSATLPATFAVVGGVTRTNKAAEERLLETVAAVEVAVKALDFFESKVLPEARKRGTLIP